MVTVLRSTTRTPRAWYLAARSSSAPPGARDATNTTITSSPKHPAANQALTLTATVSDKASPTTTPTGSVQFFLDGAPTGHPVALVAGSGQLPGVVLAAGKYVIKAVYAPDRAWYARSEGTTALTVTAAVTERVSVASDD